MSASQYRPQYPIMTMTQRRVDEYLPGAKTGRVFKIVGMRLEDGQLKHCMAGEETVFRLEIVEDAHTEQQATAKPH